MLEICKFRYTVGKEVCRESSCTTSDVYRSMVLKEKIENQYTCLLLTK